jgi:hypothetical protein
MVVDRIAGLADNCPRMDLRNGARQIMGRMARLSVAMLLLTAGVCGVAWAMGDYSYFAIPQVKYAGGNYRPRPNAVESLLAETAKRTSVEVVRQEIELPLAHPDLYRYPFIYLSGDEALPQFSAQEIANLRNYLNYGGFVLIDDNSARLHSRFDESVRKLVAQLFPHVPLQKLPEDHSVFRSFYLINQVAGRAVIQPFLEGITLRGRTVLVYSANDLGGAWARNKLGHWTYDVIGGGDAQRTQALRLGVNIVLYALTLDYKKDMVHLPIILERLRRFHSQ